ARVKPSSQRTLARGKYSASGAVRAAAAGAVGIGRTIETEVEGQTALGHRIRIETPAAEHGVSQALGSEERQFINGADGPSLANVEVRVAALAGTAAAEILRGTGAASEVVADRVDIMRPGITALEGQSSAEALIDRELKRLVIGEPVGD